MHVIGLVLAIGFVVLPQELDELSPQTIDAIGIWKGCLDANVSRVAQSPDSAEVAADSLLEYCRASQRSARAAILLDLNRRSGRDGEDTTNSLETVLVMRAKQNILEQIAAARQR